MAEYKNGENMQDFQIVNDTVELEQTLYFKGFVIKEAKYCFIYLNGNCFFLKFAFQLNLFSVLCSQVFLRIRSFALENSPRAEVQKCRKRRKSFRKF